MGARGEGWFHVVPLLAGTVVCGGRARGEGCIQTWYLRPAPGALYPLFPIQDPVLHTVTAHIHDPVPSVLVLAPCHLVLLIIYILLSP